MKKLVMAFALTMALATSGQTAMAGCGCGMPKSDDCGCKKVPTCERPCEKQCDKKCNKSCDRPTCEECGELAKRYYSDCKEQKREEMYCRLNLDSCQRSQAKEIMDRYECDLDSIHDKIKADHKCLCEKINASCLDKSAVRASERVLKDDVKELKSQLKCINKEFKKILRCEQKSEYRKIKRELKYRAKKSMKYCCKCCNK